MRTVRLLTLSEVAEQLGCSVATVKRRVQAGALPTFVDGRLIRVREVDLARYVAERVAARRPSTLASGRPASRALPPGSRLWD